MRFRWCPIRNFFTYKFDSHLIALLYVPCKKHVAEGTTFTVIEEFILLFDNVIFFPTKISNLGLFLIDKSHH
jgi:hypothetical protein